MKLTVWHAIGAAVVAIGLVAWILLTSSV